MTIAQLLPWVILLTAVSFMILWRHRGQRLRPGRMWISPTLLAGLVIVSIYAQPEISLGPSDFLIFTMTILLGIAGGIVRARTLKLAIDPADGSVLSYTDGVAIVLLTALIAVRTYARTLAELSNVQLPVIADATMLFAVSMVIAQRLVTWRRIRALRPARVARLAR